MQLPKDYEYKELQTLLSKLGFIELNKGKTCGSRVKFFRPLVDVSIMVHKPHPSKTPHNSFITISEENACETHS